LRRGPATLVEVAAASADVLRSLSLCRQPDPGRL